MTATSEVAKNGTVAQTKTQRLLPHHRKELIDGSGLKESTIHEAGIYSESDKVRLLSMLNRTGKTWKHGSAIVIPYRDSAGAVVLHTVKPDNPPKRKGKLQKYLRPTGQPARLFVPPAIIPRLQDEKARLLITEGEKKSLAATQEGFACVAIPGVDCWHGRNQTTLMPDLQRVEWQGREVYIVFDSDATTNDNVLGNERLLADVLTKHGAKVRVVRIPPTDDGNKQGLDDFLVSSGASEFNTLLQQAEEPDPPEAGEEKAFATDADPATEAETILQSSDKNGAATLCYWRGSWWRWSIGCWREITSEEIRSAVVNSMNGRWLGVKSRIVTDVMEQLRAKAIMPSTIEPPTWRGQAFAGFGAADCLAMQSEVVHLPSLVDQREIYSAPATPKFFTTTACEFDLDPQAPPSKTWLKFLGSLWGNDQQSIESLQEWFGYLLTSDTRQQKMLMIVGPKRSGKGTIARVLGAIVGQYNLAAPTLGSLTTNFGLQPLVGKSVAIISDARLSGRTDQAIVVERLLSISGEDAQTIDRKHQTAITCKLPTRFVILTNELPRLNDASGAIVSRVILLRTTKSFIGSEDHDLTDKLLGELPGILLWAAGGWHRLRQRGRFLQPDSGLEALAEMDDLSSPVAAFVRDCCIVEPGEVVAVAKLFAAWESWCKSQGREKYSGTIHVFGRDLSAAEPAIRRKRLNNHGDRTRVYEGIGLRDGF